jgi:hypothetical protein
VKAATDDLASGTGAGVTLTVTRKGKGPATAYAFESVYKGHPARWNPCHVIHYRVNLSRAGDQALADGKETLRRIHLASGLRFHYDGRTSESPDDNPTDQRAELLVGWRTPNELPVLGYAAGIGGYSSVYRNGHEVILRGYVALNAGFKGPAGFGRGGTQGQLLMHELGHAIGMAHVNGRYQIMRPVLDNYLYASMYGAGDLVGLRKLGASQGCI